MHRKLKELLDNPFFHGFIFILLAVFLAGHISRCVRNKNKMANNLIRTPWAKMLLVMDQIDKNYADSITYDQVLDKAIPALLTSLDPHSLYLPPTDLQQADDHLRGNFSGIGVEFNVPNDTAVIVSVIPGGPSEKAGLRSGDRIVSVEDTIVAGVKFNQDSLIRILRGPIDTKVRVGIKRNGEKDVLSFDIIRGLIPVHSLDAAIMLTPKLGYVKISTFSQSTHREFIAAALSLLDKGMEYMLLDLRDNPGGYMDQAYLLANEFLNKGDMVVYMEGRMRKRENFLAEGNGRLKNLKLYIAINENSASSSEIVAGAIQDNDRGVIIGRRSFGKGLVQEPIYFSDNSGIRLTVARFYTPSGRCIQKPYTADYNYDILERFQRGEMRSADSIKVNDSLKYTTVHGHTVYGGGGIIPDVFVPIDTTGITDFLIKANRKSLQMKFSSMFADRHRKRLTEIADTVSLEKLFTEEDLATQFKLYATAQGVKPTAEEWAISGGVLIRQLKGLIGRYSAMKEDAFYPYILEIDNLADKVKELVSESAKQENN